MIDVHSHILPALDDGPESMDEALRMARQAIADGIRVVVATPHDGDGIHSNHPQKIIAAVGRFRAALQGAGIPLRIVQGAEVHLRPGLPGMIQAGEVGTVMNRGRHLLLELPRDIDLRLVEDTMFQLRLEGVQTVLAHAERYRAVLENIESLRPLIRIGAIVQVSAGSLYGLWGQEVRNCAADLISHGYAHLLATDSHSANGRSPKLARGLAIATNMLKDANKARALVRDNPLSILKGMELRVAEPSLRARRRFWSLFHLF